MTNVFRAAHQNDTDKLKCWYAAGADMSTADYDNRTPLHVAIGRGHLAAAEFLLQSKAEPLAKDAFGRTPFDDAEHCPDPVAAKKLLNVYNMFI